MATTYMTQVSSDRGRIQRYLSLYSRLRNKQKNRHRQTAEPVEEQYTFPKLLYFWRRSFHVRSREVTTVSTVPVVSTPERETPIYRRLGEGEIRLIKILPGDWYSPLQCELEHVAAGSHVQYVALSYAWGTSNETEWIKLNGRDHPIKSSLAAALRRLRDYLSLRARGSDSMITVDAENFRLWADALCLNQNDLEEKQHQVPRMGTVFSRADDVYIWLQENLPEIDDAILALMRSASAIDASMDRKAALDKLAELHNHDLSLIESGLNALCRRRWFGRVWVIQELALAKRPPIMIAGDGWCDVDGLLRLFRAINPRPMEKIGLHHIMFLILMVQRQRYSKRRGTNPEPQAIAAHLKAALEHIGFFETSISHDHLYAILGLCTEGDLPAALAPSYKTPFEEVCLQYARFIIEADGNLSVLASSVKIRSKVPSWVPDFTSIITRPDRMTLPAFIKFSACGRKITVLGRQIGRCIGVHAPIEYPPWMAKGRVNDTSDADQAQDPYLMFRRFRAFLQSAADRNNLPLLEYIERWLLHTASSVLRSGVVDAWMFRESQEVLLNTYDETADAFKDAQAAALQLTEPPMLPVPDDPREGDVPLPDLHSDQAYRRGLLDALAEAMEAEQPWPKAIQDAFYMQTTHLSSLLMDSGMCASVLQVNTDAGPGDVLVCGVEEDAGQAATAVLLRAAEGGSAGEYTFVGMVQPLPGQVYDVYIKEIIEQAVPEEFVIV